MDMQNKKRIVFKIDMDTCETTVEAVGYNGVGCKEATKPFEEALGLVTDRTSKPVMWKQTAETDKATHIQQKGGAS